MYINIICDKTIEPKIPSTTLVLKYIFKISNFVIGIILSRIYSKAFKAYHTTKKA
jgi:hypothetical protein